MYKKYCNWVGIWGRTLCTHKGKGAEFEDACQKALGTHLRSSAFEKNNGGNLQLSILA